MAIPHKTLVEATVRYKEKHNQARAENVIG